MRDDISPYLQRPLRDFATAKAEAEAARAAQTRTTDSAQANSRAMPGAGSLSYRKVAA
jgi:hypothetical protein